MTGKPMPKIQLCWTKGVSETEAAGVQSGVSEVLQHVSPVFNIEIMGPTCEADAWQGSCLTEQDRGYGPQVDADRLLKWRIMYSLAKFMLDTGQDATSVSCITVAAMDADITAGDNNFLLGASRAGFGSVLSVARLRRGIRDTRIRDKVLRRLARHEFGHALGLVPEGRQSNVEEKIGLHCTNLCTMRQGMSLPEFEALTMEEERAGISFCFECAEYLRSGLTDLRLLFGGHP